MIDRVAYACLILELTAAPVSDVGVRRSFFEGRVGALWIVREGFDL